jgi:DNA repair protein RecO
MHDIHATEGIVLTKRTQGEANISIVLLTQNFGVIRASARSARLERSKLRYGLEALTMGRFSLVRGKYEWKLTGAEGLTRPFKDAPLPARRTAGRIARLLLRLIHGEDAVPRLYETVYAGLVYLSTAAPEHMEPAEWVLVLRVLSRLGYVEERESLRPFLGDKEMTPLLLEQARQARVVLIRGVNESLSATGL